MTYLTALQFTFSKLPLVLSMKNRVYLFIYNNLWLLNYWHIAAVFI